LANVTYPNSTFYFNVGARATDDPRNDLKPLTMTNFTARLSNHVYQLNVGDTLESFSQYTLSSAIKGFSYRFKNEEKNTPEYTVVYGYAYPRWDNFYGDSEVKTIKRTAYGARVKKGLSPYFTTGLSFVRFDDSNRINTTDPLYDGNVVALDWEYKPFEGLSLSGESSWSDTKQSPSAGAADINGSGTAHRLLFQGEGGPIRLSVEYERVSPDFQSLMGCATADREKVKARWREKRGRNSSITYGLLWFRDNLSGQKAYTTNHYRPEIIYTQRRLFNRQYASGDFSYRLDRAFGAPQGVTNHYLNLGYHDRFGSFDCDTNLGYTKYSTTLAGRDSEEMTYNTSLGTRFTRGDTIVKPSISLGGWTASDDLADETDTIREAAVGLGLDFPKSKIVSNLKVGTHKLSKGNAASDDSSRTFVNLSVYYRAPFLEQMNQGQLFLRVAINDYSFSTVSRDFVETSVTAGVSSQF